MSLSTCPKCWDDPCTCGEQYHHLSIEDLTDLIRILSNILESKKNCSHSWREFLPTDSTTWRRKCTKCGYIEDVPRI